MSNNQITKNSINDLAYIQRLLNRIESNEFSMPLNKFALEINILFQSLCLLFAMAFVGYELVSSGGITSSMLLSANDSELGHLGMQTVLLILLGLVAVFYYLVWRASVASGRDLSQYLEVNFKFLKNLSLISDLLVKFIVVYLMVTLGQPQFVSLLLVLFVGDYLIQGRFFNLSLRLSLIAGMLCFVVAGLLYWQQNFGLIYPLILFSSITLISVFNLVQSKKMSVAQ
ncbi:hypothetical protein K2P97_09260 [bacterium]|nr:hypothetical protein [bacterium]